MSLLMYAVADCDPDEVDGSGLGGHELKSIAENGLVAIVSDQDGSRPQASEETLWEYERVVEELMRRYAILPARFGSVLEGEPAAHAALRDRREQLRAALDRVRGAVELGVRGSWVNGEQQTTKRQASGTAYMLGQLELHRRAAELVTRLDSLRALSRGGLHRVFPAPGTPVLAAYLVDKARVRKFTAAVAELDEELDDVTLVCTGPWPPYSFVERGQS